VEDRPRFKGVYSKALATATGCSTRTAKRARHGGCWIIFYVDSGLELKHKEKGKIVLPWSDFFDLLGGHAAGWRALPKSYECFELNILAVSTAAPPH
jgi:hypothetical protein